MGLFDGLSQRDGAPQAMAPMSPQYNGNLGAPANTWQGNQMQIPGLAAYLAQGQKPQGMAGMMMPQQEAPHRLKHNNPLDDIMRNPLFGGLLGSLFWPQAK